MTVRTGREPDTNRAREFCAKLDARHGMPDTSAVRNAGPTAALPRRDPDGAVYPYRGAAV